jgi:ABC-type Fe3+/spermidine/putrescine transport system ATPase subunit
MMAFSQHPRFPGVCASSTLLPTQSFQQEGAGYERGEFNETLVSFRGVQKSYDGETLIVKDLNLDIRKGEFLTLLGPSGSGKTTSLMMLAGFETPTAGEIQLAGRSINNVPPHKRDIGMVFQNYALFPHMTVAENLAFPLTVRGMSKTDVSERVKRVLNMVQLDAFAKRYPASCPVASSSVWPWPAPWCSNRNWC